MKSAKELAEAYDKNNWLPPGADVHSEIEAAFLAGFAARGKLDAEIVLSIDIEVDKFALEKIEKAIKAFDEGGEK